MRCGVVDKLRELYARYPMTVVRVAGFFIGVPAVCIIMVVIHELMGFDVYQRLYAPILCALASVHFFFLRKAAIKHTWSYHESWHNHNSSFYEKYAIFLTVLIVWCALGSIGGIFES